jgi:hypothetical protein
VHVSRAKGHAVVTLLRCCTVRSVCYWVAPGEFIEKTVVDLINELWELAVLCLLASKLC